MDKHGSWRNTEGLEIDLADLLRGLCMHWKQAVICAVAFALLSGGYGYRKVRSSPDIQEAGAGEGIVLTEEEQRGVTAAVELESEIRGMEEYIENSILMQIDPYHKDRITMLYGIDGAKRQELEKIMESYLNFIMNGGAADELKKPSHGGWDLDKSYLAELIVAGQKVSGAPYQIVVGSESDDSMQAGAVFYVEVTGKDTKMAQRLALDMQSVIKAYRIAVEDAVDSHKLVLLSCEESVIADDGLQARQHEKRTLLSSYLQSLREMADGLGKWQMVAYQSAIGREDSKEAPEEAEVPGSFGVWIKYVLLGLVAGIFVYCCIYACQYLLRDTVKSAEEIKRLYSFPFYGSIHLGKRASRDSYGQEKPQVLNRIRLACRKRGITRLCAVSGYLMDAQEKECMESIAEQLKSWEIDMVIEENAIGNTAGWDTLAEAGNVLLVCRIGMTTHRMIDEEMRFYMENGMAVLGAVTFSFQR